MLKLLFEIFIVSTRLGLTSFGGPSAHLGYFHEEYVRRKKWLDEKGFADLVALCHFLPGPASSQVGIGIGVTRAGLLGGIVSWIGFTLPSVLLLILFAMILQDYQLGNSPIIHGLKLVAVAIVGHAILGMGQKLAPDKIRASIAIVTTLISLWWMTSYTQIILILTAGLIGYILFKQDSEAEKASISIPISKRVAIFCLTLFVGLLILLPILREFSSSSWLTIFESLYRSSSLVFGGGHVILPLLEREFVPTGFVSAEDFLAGYGATQAVPGPLFTFAAYLGALMGGVWGGLLATFAIFLPSFLLVIGALPFWNDLRSNPGIQAALKGVNAAVVGILLAVFFQPLWTHTVLSVYDFGLALVLFGLLQFWKISPWIIVVLGAGGGVLLSML